MNGKETIKLILLVTVIRMFSLLFPLLFNYFLTAHNYLDFSSFASSSLSFWDAHHYIHLSKYGYTDIGDAANYIVFQPFYPLLISLFTRIFTSPVFSGLFVSNVSIIVGSFILYKLLLLDYSPKTTNRIILLLNIFPTSFFFSLIYTESLFLLLSVSSIFFIRKKHYFVSGVLTGLAILTRHQGVLLPLVFFAEYKNQKNKNVLNVLSYLIPTILSVLVYFVINQYIFDNPFEFLVVLKNHWNKEWAFFTTGIIQSFKIAFLHPFSEHSLTVGFAEGLTSIVSILLIPLAFRKLKLSYFFWYTFSIMLFTSTKFILSSPRYLLTIPVFFILLEGFVAKNSKFYLWVIFSFFLMILSAFLYVKGNWIF